MKRVKLFLNLADQLEAKYKSAKARIDQLTSSILAKAFRGELVPQDPNDGPAEKLLESIWEERGTIVAEVKKSKKKITRR